jgi:hypothetical protein
METFKDYPSIVIGMNGTKGMKLYISKRSLKQGSIRLAKSPRGVIDRMFRIGNFNHMNGIIVLKACSGLGAGFMGEAECHVDG